MVALRKFLADVFGIVTRTSFVVRWKQATSQIAAVHPDRVEEYLQIPTQTIWHA